MAITLDIDTGGTFTDGFVVSDGEPHVVKVLTTPHDLAVCFAEVVEAAAAALGLDVDAMLARTEAVRYATTVGTNTVIQRNGPKLGLLTDAQADPPGAAIFLTEGMRRTVGSAGAAAVTNGDGHASRVVGATRELLDDSARGLVCSMSEDAGGVAAERDIEAVFREHYPRQCLDTVPLMLAGDLTSDLDPARRASTALFNAYVHPAVAEYLYRAEDFLRDHGYRRPLLVVHNDGGCARVAKTIAAKTYNSGPTAGVAGAATVARSLGLDSLVTLDMGGTSLDVAVIRDGEVPQHEHGEIEGVAISFPLPDLRTLGAGGGSIAHVHEGELRVGPQSAGSMPGPACFGFGGDRPTVTDADVVLGIIRPEAFLGGAMKIDADAARAVVAKLGEELGCTHDEAAERIRATVHAETGRELAAELLRAGLEPAGAVALAFGGNGATHATGIAEAAGIREVITFPFSPVFSAFGASTADVRHIYEAPVADGAEDDLRLRALRDMRGEGFAADEVAIAASTRDSQTGSTLVVEAVRTMPHLALAASSGGSADAAPALTTEVRWPGHGPTSTAVYRRADLGTGARVDGPALIESGETTCALPPGWSLTLDDHGAERLTREETR